MNFFYILRRMLMFSICWAVTFSSDAHATTYAEDTCVYPHPQSLDYNTAHILASSVTTSGCMGLLWISPQDKEIFALAITAAINKKYVKVVFDNASTSVSVPYLGGSVATTCKVLAISFVYTQPGVCPGL